MKSTKPQLTTQGKSVLIFRKLIYLLDDSTPEPTWEGKKKCRSELYWVLGSEHIVISFSFGFSNATWNAAVLKKSAFPTNPHLSLTVYLSVQLWTRKTYLKKYLFKFPWGFIFCLNILKFGKPLLYTYPTICAYWALISNLSLLNPLFLTNPCNLVKHSLGLDLFISSVRTVNH